MLFFFILFTCHFEMQNCLIIIYFYVSKSVAVVQLGRDKHTCYSNYYSPAADVYYATFFR